MENIKTDNLKEALELVDITYNGKVLNPPIINDWPNFGKLIPLSETECVQLETLRNLISCHARQKTPTRPLCIAVFGPPGSGKSFTVKEICNEVQRGTGFALILRTINLTQLNSTIELSSSVYTNLQENKKNTMPVLFFDEFDSAYSGTAYGWLSWFLSPMHYGHFIYKGKLIPINRAVLVFAGGTAATMGIFTNHINEFHFRNAKGPDFLSRLRGYLDVPGPNTNPRLLRRALILREEINNCVKRNRCKSVRVKRELLEAILQVGRFRHGARSISALLENGELCSNIMDWNILPNDHLIDMQVDRGPLDARSVGGYIARLVVSLSVKMD